MPSSWLYKLVSSGKNSNSRSRIHLHQSIFFPSLHIPIVKHVNIKGHIKVPPCRELYKNNMPLWGEASSIAVYRFQVLSKKLPLPSSHQLWQATQSLKHLMFLQMLRLLHLSRYQLPVNEYFWMNYKIIDHQIHQRIDQNKISILYKGELWVNEQ